MSSDFQIGQRWISETEPELGLGSIREVTDRTVSVEFAAANQTRQYALDNAPLRRARFQKGDQIQRRDGSAFLVREVAERKGLVVYRSGDAELPESELDEQTGFGKPEQRLLNGQCDPPEAFDLRLAALEHQSERRRSKVRGFVGGRIELIPHQLSIATEVTERLAPRVLLADEVGLGKTIEACLIVHRLIQTGRAQRVLVLVPEPLIHQWFVELLRRFNLWFHIFDEERCDAIETASPDANPFLEDQWILCGVQFLAKSQQRQAQAVAAGWDILVIDEAHHLGWSPQAVSPEYALAEALASKTQGLLLLTATPEQLGFASHFARLRLLDPDRYYDLDEFLREAGQYRQVAGIANKLLQGETLDSADVEILARILHRPEAQVMAQLSGAGSGAAAVRNELIGDLLDQHGTGRVMFRNTRATITGFPARITHLHRLEVTAGSERLYDSLASEFAADTAGPHAPEFEPSFSDDPRIIWLAELLRTLDGEKVLLICRSQAKVEAIARALAGKINARVALFHEGVPLVQRDRNAAWFAEADGAQILLASEIGSEGRNFQFAHHLVLFDLPLDPELVEQRIGRLDRIGQKGDIHLHVPFIKASPQEALAIWFDAGLNALTKNLRGGHQLLEQFGHRIHDLAQDFHETQDTSRAALEELIRQTRAAADELALRLEQGRDRLLELNSFHPDSAERIVRGISQHDRERALDRFMLAIFDHYGVQLEELADRTFHVGSAGVFADTFPGLPSSGFTLTSSRELALAREDVQFLTGDHPLVTGALDLILGSATGNSSVAHWPDPGTEDLYLEAVYVLECVAPPQLHVDRFLPPTPLRVVVDQRGADAETSASRSALRGILKRADPYLLLEQPEFREELLPELIRKTETLIRQQVPPIIAAARAEMHNQLNHELSRLTELRKVNRNVRPEEIELLVDQERALDQALASARLRLDAVRVIRRGPKLGSR